MTPWLRGVLLLLAMCVAAPQARATEPSPVLGRWSVDVSRLPMPPEARPKRVTFAFDAVESDKWRIRVEIVQADGSERISTATVALDGSTSAIAGDTLEADAIAARLPQPGVLVLALGKARVPASTRVYAVSADGRHLVETATHFGADGKAVMRMFQLHRAH